MPAETAKKFAVYKSSAGSGKTYTLVKEYLQLVIGNPERYSGILAITFTNKAANEMKERIVLRLKELSVQDKIETSASLLTLADEIGKNLGFDRTKIAQRANQALSLILHNYSSFAVRTIDSFVHKLVMTFASDLGLPATFEVELEKEKLVTKSVDMLISKAGADADLTKVLVEFITGKMEDEHSWNIKTDLKSFAGSIIEEKGYEALKKIGGLSVSDFLEISGKLKQIAIDFEKKIQVPAVNAIETINSAGISPEAMYRGKQGIFSYFSRIASRDFSSLKPNSYVMTTIEEGKWKSPKCTKTEGDAIDSVTSDLLGYFTEIQTIKKDHHDDYVISKMILKNIYLVAVLSELEKVMEDFRQNENIVHISEFNKRIATLVQKEAVPYIYERVGEKYRHFLLDEFQDTSLLQWQNLIPLLENSLSANNFNMIVGDGKQAIYRWRNGEVAQFAALPEIYNRTDDPLSISRENLFKSQYKAENLDKNYRSCTEIIDFNNRFFEFAKLRLSDNLKPIYAETIQRKDVSKSGGYLQFEFLKDDVADDEDKGVVRPNRVLGILKSIEESKQFTPSQIAILVRTNIQASEVASYLLQNGVSVISSEALFLSSSAEVRFIVALLKCFVAENDRIAITQILLYLLRQGNFAGRNLHQLLAGCREINPANPAGQSIRVTLKDFGLDLDMPNLKTYSLTDLVELMVNTFRLDPPGQNPFIRFFMDMVHEQATRQELSVYDFLEFWDESGYKNSIIIPEGTESVNLMTVHKAKGLQFPVVICPYVLDSGNNTPASEWIDPQLKAIPELKAARISLTSGIKETAFGYLYQNEHDKSFLDLLNLLYVAMTRPEKRLYVLLKDKTNEAGQWKYSTTIADTSDLLYDFLNNENFRRDETGRYYYGTPSSPSNADIPAEALVTEPVTASKLREAMPGGWRNKITLRQQAKRYWVGENESGQREFGLLVHRIMSRISFKSDLDRVLSEMLIEGSVAPNQVEPIKSTITEVMARPGISRFFADGLKVMNEKEILLIDGKILRPDRVVIENEKVTVIDYKTGKKDPGHQQQMAGYIVALQQMGYPDVDYQLVYLNT